MPKTDDPECRVDQDCSTKLACIGETCQNPCQIDNPCTGNQRCVVTDTLPIRTVACICPDGLVFTQSGNCKKGNFSISLSTYNIRKHYLNKRTCMSM